MSYSSNTTTNSALLSSHVHITNRSTDTNERVARFGKSCRFSTINPIGRKAKTKVGPALKERYTNTIFVICFARWRLTHRQIEIIFQFSNLPTFNLLTFHKPPPKHFLRHRLERGIRAAVELDLVVERAENPCNGMLFGK